MVDSLIAPNYLQNTPSVATLVITEWNVSWHMIKVTSGGHLIR